MKRRKEYNLKVVFPELANEWHPLKNEILTPEDVPPRAFLHAWWKCRRGHEWVATVLDRCNGAGCPYCRKGRRKVSKEYNLAVLHPDAARLWHPTKNGSLTPRDMPPASGKDVWWKCEKGHQWKARIASVQKYPICPRCSKTILSEEYNLAVLHSNLVREWHPTKNGKLKPSQVMPGSGKMVWWMCKQGHEWQARVLHRHQDKCSCPYCSGRKSTKENNLAVCYPEVARLWHPFKNHALTPRDVTPRSHKIVWWRCDKNHEWQESISIMRKRVLCPYCSGVRLSDVNNLQYNNPQLASQWHPHKNGDLTPDKVRPRCSIKVWWVCDKGHEYEATVGNRNRAKISGCPYCSGKKVMKEESLAATHPELAAEWHPVNNSSLTPWQVKQNYQKKVWWKCAKGHEWAMPPARRTSDTKNRDCPFCAGEKKDPLKKKPRKKKFQNNPPVMDMDMLNRYMEHIPLIKNKIMTYFTEYYNQNKGLIEGLLKKEGTYFQGGKPVIDMDMLKRCMERLPLIKHNVMAFFARYYYENKELIETQWSGVKGVEKGTAGKSP